MCDYRSGTIECRGDGYLWDADNDGFDPRDKSLACPNCNTKEYLLNAKEEAETTSYFISGPISGTGVTYWESAVAHATKWNKKDTDAALSEIGTVEAIYEDRLVECCYQTQVFNYNQQGQQID